ncbi:MAG: hypothetical protein O6830_07315 [Candidatus Dadabacteria bacterium]|nr:hypothetical protein [Candidatus Dadabacteria bacterium]
MTNQVKDHQLTIKKNGDEWKVVSSDDPTKTKVKAKKKEKITWRAEGSDVYFEFMTEGLFGKYKDKLKDGKRLTLMITEDADLGIHRYSVFCLADLEFAKGDSPPEIDLID